MRDLRTSPICFDVETSALPNAADYIEPAEAAANLVDPVKVAADKAKRHAANLAKAGLDWNTGRLVCVGWWTAERGGAAVPIRNEDEEADILHEFWMESRGRTLVGFNVKGFDLPFMIQRSRYLGISAPQLDLGRYSKGSSIVDLFMELTFNNAQDTYCMRRTLHNFCKRFSIPVEDQTTGSDIPALLEAGNWPAITAHCLSDVELTLALAQKLGFVRQAEVVGVL